MADFSISGRMTVKKLKEQFKESFGGTLRVYHGVGFANDSDTIAKIRKAGAEKAADFKVVGNLTCGSFEKRILDNYGIKVQVANKDNSALVDGKKTLADSGRA